MRRVGEVLRYLGAVRSPIAAPVAPLPSHRLVATPLFLLIMLGNWALTQWLSISIRSKIETRDELAEEIGQQRRLLQDLEATTWGVELREMSNGRFVVLEKGTEPQTGWVVDERPAVRLSSD